MLTFAGLLALATSSYFGSFRGRLSLGDSSLYLLPLFEVLCQWTSFDQSFDGILYMDTVINVVVMPLIKASKLQFISQGRLSNRKRGYHSSFPKLCVRIILVDLLLGYISGV